MELRLFSFNKTEKTPQIIEDKINAFLEEDNAFRFCSQSESTKTGKFHLSLYYEKAKSNIRARVFKDSNVGNLQELINKFLKEGHTMKWSCQSSSTTSIYLVIFYELGKANNGKEKN